VYNNIVMAEKRAPMKVPNGVCGGGSRYQENSAKIIAEKGSFSVGMIGQTDVAVVALDELVPTESIAFFHLDVEGAELSVLRSATNLLRSRRIKVLIWEFAPHRWKEWRTAALAETIKFMHQFRCINIQYLAVKVSEDPFADAEHTGKFMTTPEEWTTFYELIEKGLKGRPIITDILCYLK
jgi:hypothetical protein